MVLNWHEAYVTQWSPSNRPHSQDGLECKMVSLGMKYTWFVKTIVPNFVCISYKFFFYHKSMLKTVPFKSNWWYTVWFFCNFMFMICDSRHLRTYNFFDWVSNTGGVCTTVDAFFYGKPSNLCLFSARHRPKSSLERGSTRCPSAVLAIEETDENLPEPEMMAMDDEGKTTTEDAGKEQDSPKVEVGYRDDLDCYTVPAWWL